MRPLRLSTATLFSIAAVALLAACGNGNPTAHSQPDGDQQGLFGGDALELRVGQPLQLERERLEIEVREVADSRCPVGATCVWEGQVGISVGVVEDGRDLGTFEIVLHAGDEDKAVAVAGGQTIKLLHVTPLPMVGVELQPSDYAVTLKVSKAAASEASQQRWSLDGWLDGEYARDMDRDGDIDSRDFQLFVNQRPSDGQPRR